MSGRILVMLLVVSCIVCGEADVETDAKDFLKKFDNDVTPQIYRYNLASWAYNTNITKETADKLVEEGKLWSDFYAGKSVEAQNFSLDNITDAEIKLQLITLQDRGASVLSQEKFTHLSQIMSDMSTIYSTATVCLIDEPFNCQTLEPGLEHVMAHSRNYSERLHVWEGWRREVGKRMRPLYEDYVDLKNEAAKLNGFEDYGDYWRFNYETIEEDPEYKYTRDMLMEDVQSIYNDILPLYRQLHAYVRSRLMKVYPGHIDPEGPIPAHLLGDMWGRFWTNLYPLTAPYPNKYIDVSETMVQMGWNADRMFKEAEKFFMSVGLYDMLPNFWINSMTVKPKDGTQVVCHPTAWDMGNRQDFRIKMCTKVNMDDFLTVHHEMGHTQYQMAYRNLTYLLRDGANEGFHEAVGEIMSLSAATPEHLKDLGLLPANFTSDNETEINFLLKQALTIVATLPFTYMLEKWRWEVFAGNITKDKWMESWWEMKRDLVGVVEPVLRDETYCDPPALFHVSGDYSFIRYFTRTIYQFQFQKALCDEAGHKGDLFTCDITNSTAAGTKLRNMLEMGRSQSWTRALQNISGDVRMDARPLLDYFHKLHEWLTAENREHNRNVEWRKDRDPYSDNVIRVRISLRAAMGDNAYPWNDNEMYLFKANIAYALRQYYSQRNTNLPFTAENVLISDVTPRISFNILVTDPLTPSQHVPRSDLEAAIELSQSRINAAFHLSDSTLEFEGIIPTLAPPVQQPVQVWLVVFGVVMGIVLVAGIFLIISGVRDRKKKSAAPALENPYEEITDGQSNKAFEDNNSEQTGF